ncbi:retrovirus-related Pol polyprotein from transposon 17.6 [Trichonephila clavipes]|nr:retrovirus-related Pol polyprotein from transposon 17.6 [Trichonephila clavipes]
MAEPPRNIPAGLFLLDRKSGQKFLIDSGSEICVIPPSLTMNKSPQSNFSLFAANNTKNSAMVEFEFLLAQGIIRPSKSPWSSPLHVVPKSDSTVRPVGKTDSKPLNWSSEAITAFQRCKQALADAALLAHPSPSAPLALHVDASDYAMGGTLRKLCTLSYSHWLSFSENLLHLKSLTVPTTVNSLLSTLLSDTFGICWKLEDFTVFTDHKPLTYAFRQKKVTSVLHGRSVSWISSLSSPQILYTFRI